MTKEIESISNIGEGIKKKFFAQWYGCKLAQSSGKNTVLEEILSKLYRTLPKALYYDYSPFPTKFNSPVWAEYI